MFFIALMLSFVYSAFYTLYILLLSNLTHFSIDLEQILQEAQHRWLRPIEICEILRNYHKFCIAPEPPNKPPSMVHFLTKLAIFFFFIATKLQL